MTFPEHIEMRGNTVVVDDTPVATLNPDAPPHKRRRLEDLVSALERNGVRLAEPGDDDDEPWDCE
jgi:antitoxin (DNA-binding transcriptional repressor) of toxin-antitoxin stability system